ncbi:MAG: PilZ domain-containing protein [Candidatus Acidiferrales bacterium]
MSHPPDAGSRFGERRSVPRFAFIASLEIDEPLSNTRISGRVIEISQKGCCAEVANPLPVNSFIQLRIKRDEAAFETWARVIYDRQGVGMGFLFIRTAADQSKVLDTWLVELKGS